MSKGEGMAKKKTFDVEIKETDLDSEEQTSLIVLINGEEVGRVEETAAQVFEAVYNEKRTMTLPNVDEAVEFVIREYNLHGMS